MTPIKMYSPSAIKVYAECPIKYELKYLEHWEPREPDRGYWGRVAGSAFAVGSAILNAKVATVGIAIIAAQKSITDDTDLFIKAGGYLDRGEIEKVRADLTQALTKYANNNPFSNWKEITYVEHSLGPEYGNPRLDVIGRDQNNVLSFADIKFKRNLATEYVAKTVEEYRYDWQFLHYQWAMESTFNEPVNAYLCLVRLKTAWQSQLFEFTYSPDLIRAVGLSAVRWSEKLSTDIDRGPSLGTSHDTKYGPCPYKDACLKMNWDEELMKAKYVQVERS